MPDEMPARAEDEWPRGTFLYSDQAAGVVFAERQKGKGVAKRALAVLWKIACTALGHQWQPVDVWTPDANHPLSKTLEMGPGEYILWRRCASCGKRRGSVEGRKSEFFS